MPIKTQEPKFYWYFWRGDGMNAFKCKTLQEAKDLESIAASHDGTKVSGFFGITTKPHSAKEIVDGLIEDDIERGHEKPTCRITRKKPYRGSSKNPQYAP